MPTTSTATGPGTGYSTTTDNEQTASPGYTYTYDNAGNLIAQTNTSTHVMTTYTYDYRNRLTEVEVGGTIVATYTYDALNDRIGIDDNGTQTWTVYDGTNPYADYNGSGALEERYQSGPGMVDGAVVNELLARTSASGTTAWYLTDKLDSVRDIVNSSGTELDHIVYDSFGNIVTETNASDGDRFKFAGMEYDSTTGRYYDRARGYDPTTGRFMGQDPDGFAAGSLNLSEYVGNDPTDLFDPTGLQGSGGGQEEEAEGEAEQDQAKNGQVNQAQEMDKMANQIQIQAILEHEKAQWELQQAMENRAVQAQIVIQAQQLVNNLQTAAARQMMLDIMARDKTIAALNAQNKRLQAQNAAQDQTIQQLQNQLQAQGMAADRAKVRPSAAKAYSKSQSKSPPIATNPQAIQPRSLRAGGIKMGADSKGVITSESVFKMIPDPNQPVRTHSEAPKPNDND